MRILYLFPDTNIFIQCRPLEELDWSRWNTFDEIHLIVCRPVQREIDNQKGKGNDRVGKRARRTHSQFRNVIISDRGYELIRESAPQVKLLVDPSWVPSPDLKDRLDYNKPDDEIVGCLHAFRTANPGVEAKLLTHDSGPMASARMLSLPFTHVPDEWLVRPESNEDESERRRLESELTRYRKAEPRFHVQCLNEYGQEIDSLNFEYQSFQPLTDSDIGGLVSDLRNQFPMATKFDELDSIDYSLPVMSFGLKEVFEPASDEEIAQYTNELYPAWLQQCEDVFRGLHLSLQDAAGPPTFRFTIANEGSRPGKDVLITFTARGNFRINWPDPKRDSSDDDDNDDGIPDAKDLAGTILPAPPPAPKGKLIRRFVDHFSSAMGDYAKHLQRQFEPFSGLTPILEASLRLPRIPSANEHDPNKFYYKARRSPLPIESFGLTCDQWRHNLEAEDFFGEIYFSGQTEEIRGALECQIHAENLTDPARKLVSVSITISLVNIRDEAKALTNELAQRMR